MRYGSRLHRWLWERKHRKHGPWTILARVDEDYAIRCSCDSIFIWLQR